MQLRRILLIVIIFAISACDRPQEMALGKLSIGVVSYGSNNESLQKYVEFKKYLGIKQNSTIELEPTYNEVRALTQIANKKWDLVFAPPGLAAIATSEYDYEALVPLDGRDKTRSVIVAKSELKAKDRQDLAGQTIALGQKGSATGYYLPIFNLYGLNFKEVVYASTPKDVLELINNNKVTVGALSLEDYNILKRNYQANQFKIIYLDQHNIPSGAVLISDRLERNQQEQIRLALTETPSFIASNAGYLTTEQLPDYSYLTRVIERVREVLEESPMVLQ